MLRFFGGIVRFFEWLRVWDDRLEAVWLSKSWPEFIKWWFGSSLALGVFALLLICIPRLVLVEVSRLYQFVKLGSYPAAGAMYAALGSFAVAFAAVVLTLAVVSCPLFMLQIRHGRR